MKVIGLTGGISSGKSFVSEYLANTYNIPIIDGDEVARKNSRVFHKILNYFGPEILDDTGDLDRKKLAKIVFDSKQKRDFLNKTTHMAIGLEMLKRVIIFYLKGKKVIILDAPLLFETKLNKYVYKTIVVSVPPEVQLQRLINRDNVPEEEAKNKINSQMKNEDKCKLADYVIDNGMTRENTKSQVDDVYRKLFKPVADRSYLYHYRYPIVFVLCAAYLWFNITPKSKL